MNLPSLITPRVALQGIIPFQTGAEVSLQCQRDFVINKLMLDVVLNCTGTGNWTAVNTLAPLSLLRRIAFGRNGKQDVVIDGEILWFLNKMLDRVDPTITPPVVGSAVTGAYRAQAKIEFGLTDTDADWGRRALRYDAPGNQVLPSLSLLWGTVADVGTCGAGDEAITVATTNCEVVAEQDLGLVYASKADHQTLQVIAGQPVLATTPRFVVPMDVRSNLQAIFIKSELNGTPADGILNGVTALRSGSASLIQDVTIAHLRARARRRFQMPGVWPAGFDVIWLPGDYGDRSHFLRAQEMALSELVLELNVTGAAGNAISVYTVGYKL